MSATALAGRRVLVTGSAEKGDRLERLLAGAGAAVLRVPLIETQRLAGDAEIRAAVARLHGGAGTAWLALASETGVRLLAESGTAVSDGVRVAAVGPATAAAARDRGLDVALVPDGVGAAALDRSLARAVGPGDRVLLVTAAGGGDGFGPAVRVAGAALETLVLYRSVLPAGAAARFRAALRAPSDAVVFTSTSTVRHATAALGGAAPPACVAACIGGPSAAAATAAGWRDVHIAAAPTPEALLALLVERLTAPQTIR